MIGTMMMRGLSAIALAVGLWPALPSAAIAQDDAKDWPMYNRDVIGTRHNRGETAINATNASRLEEKWRFPAKGDDFEIGVIHATPIVADGYVYFGTASDAAVYKLSPDGKLKWSYRNSSRPAPKPPKDEKERTARFQSSPDGILASALVTRDTVFFVDIGGWVYALDRATGKERWKLNARAKGFPGAHDLNGFFASPIMADGNVIVAGGTLEQVIAAFPGYKGCTGRGFVMALEPATGKIVWKYDVGPPPQTRPSTTCLPTGRMGAKTDDGKFSSPQQGNFRGFSLENQSPVGVSSASQPPSPA